MDRCRILDGDGRERCACDPDRVLELLANDRRREVVAALEATNADWIGFDRLVKTLSDGTDAESDSDWRIELHHCHLPALEAEGLLEYDVRGETIRYYYCELVPDVLAAVDAD